jgi:hypothetical protein
MAKRYVCVSGLCRREANLEFPPVFADSEIVQPICNCGSVMKKVYSKPYFVKLSKGEAVERLSEFIGEVLSEKE